MLEPLTIAARALPPMQDVTAHGDGCHPHLLQSGCKWALLPHDSPPKSTVHHYFKRFGQNGAWARIHDGLCCRVRHLGGRNEQPAFAINDSQSDTENGYYKPR